MKIFRNISSFLGYLAYKNLMLVFFLYLFLVIVFCFLALSSIIEPYLFSFSIIRFCIFFIIGIITIFSFPNVLKNIGSENYHIAILKATHTRDNLNKPRSWMTLEIFSKISVLIVETRQTKDPEKLNGFIQKVQKIDELKKNQKEKRDYFKKLPDEINNIDTEIYLLENSLLP